MDTAAEIKRALITAFSANPNLPITATIVSIENDTCTVRLLSELVLSDVRLKATISDDTDTFLIIPKIGSEVVLMSQTGELSGLMVVKIDSIERITYKRADFEFIVDGTTKKVTLKKDGANLGALVSSLITEIQNAIILTPAGPGQIAPTTKTKLTALDTKFKTLLNNN
jgi:hypothetical protein